ncbi:MAG: exodeoxyribonuclease VII large subunit [Phycisphaerales bacterium]
MTGRLPFDPKKMKSTTRGAEGTPDPPAPRSRAPDAPIGVSVLCARIDRALKDGLPARVRVIGQISGFTERTHWYFQLKDEGAVVGCVMFASAARKAGFTPSDGAEVVASGRVDFYAKSGRVSLIVDSIRAVGVGALEERFRALCAELRGLGWFDEARKRAMPVFPRRIAVITSRTGAALQDVIATARARCPAVEIAVIDARVQGESAAPEVARAIRALSDRHHELGIDALLITRGGGSIEDLWAFNERIVAEAIVDCRLPVVAAIGHESDTTIAELVADVRCSTPTQAAVRLVPDREALTRELDTYTRRARESLRSRLRFEVQRLESLGKTPTLADPRGPILVHRDRVAVLRRRLGQAVEGALARAGRRVDRATVRLERHRPAVAHERRSARVGALSDRLRRAGALLLERSASDVESLSRELDAVGPGQVLARGYSVTLDASGRPVRSVGGVTPGVRVTTRVADGSFESDVVGGGSVETPAGDTPRASRGPRRRRGGRGQMDLFDAGG